MKRALAVCLACWPALVPAGLPGVKPNRTVSEVEAAAKRVLAACGAPELAAMGFLDVSQAPYNADPSGRRDATAAIQRALSDAQDAQLVAYLPAGRYLVSDTIHGVLNHVLWDQWPYDGFSDPCFSYRSALYPCVLMGSTDGGRATIVLADGAPGFGDPDNPKPVIYFWALADRHIPSLVSVPADFDQSSINHNQQILSLDLDLGRNNPGAIGLHLRGAEGASIEDINIRATGAFAGMRHAPGSGGSTLGITVTGGRFGLYMPGSQPAPLITDVRLSGQTESSIYYAGRGPLTLVGADIRGAPIRGAMPAPHYDGAINIVDSIIRVSGPGPVIATPRSIVLENVWLENTEQVAKIADHPPVPGTPRGWTHVIRYAAGGVVRFSEVLGGQTRRDPIWINRRAQDAPVIAVKNDAGAPPEPVLGRHRVRSLPHWNGTGTANVRRPPWSAIGDGEHDDTAAIQSAIDAHDVVFLPKGTYRVSQPLRLRENTTLFGVSRLISIITTGKREGAFSDPNHPHALVETIDDAGARTMLARLKLEMPLHNPCVYALRWRAGRESVVRNVLPMRTYLMQRGFWHPEAPPIGLPTVRIEGAGGGSWYALAVNDCWNHGPDYRHLLVSGTREPLRFYHLQPQIAQSETMVELRDARNVDIYSIKSEGFYSTVWLRECRNIRLFGYGGNSGRRPGYALLKLVDCEDVMLANIYPAVINTNKTICSMFVAYDPRTWHAVSDGAVQIDGHHQFVLYQLGRP